MNNSSGFRKCRVKLVQLGGLPFGLDFGCVKGYNSSVDGFQLKDYQGGQYE